MNDIWFDKIFVFIIGLIIITIFVVEVSKHWDYRDVKLPPPPPATNLKPIQKPARPTEDDDDAPPKYKPLYSRSSIARTAYLLDGSFMENYDKYGTFHEGTGIEDFFNILGALFKLAIDAIYVMVTFPIHIVDFGEAFLLLAKGVIDLFVGFIEQLVLILSDTATLVGDIARCGFTWMQNLRICFLWYCVDLMFYVLHLVLFWIPIYILRLLTLNKVDLNQWYLAFFGVSDSNPFYKMRDIDGNICRKDGLLEKIDQKVNKQFRFHFMHFPDYICEKCYGCDIIGDIGELTWDSTLGLLQIFVQPIEDVFGAGTLLWRAFYLDEWM
jgi:hypothetical protein